MPVSPCETGGASETHRWGAKFFAAARDDWRDKGLAEWGARPGKSIMHRQSVAMDVPVGARRPLSMPLRCSGREAIVHAELLMSRLAALGQTATSRQVRVVSDLAPIADVRRGVPNVGFVPVDETARAVGRRCGRHDQDDSASGASCLEDEGVATSLKTECAV